MRVLNLFWLIILGILLIPSTTFCQDTPKNSVSLNFAPIHTLYDGQGFYNKKSSPEWVKWNIRNPFRSKLRFSIGMRYTRAINSSYLLSLDFYSFQARYLKTDASEYLSNQYNLEYKTYWASAFLIAKRTNIGNHFKLDAGSGFVIRKNRDDMIKTFGDCPNCTGMGYAYHRHEFGLNVRIGLHYLWTKRISTYLELQQTLILYQSDSFNRNIFFESGAPKSFFSKYESFLNFGFGISF